MKVRIGFGPGRIWGMEPDRLGPLIDELEGYGFDSLWLTEYIGHKSPDPMVGLAFAAGRVRRLKISTQMSCPIAPTTLHEREARSANHRARCR